MIPCDDQQLFQMKGELDLWLRLEYCRNVNVVNLMESVHKIVSELPTAVGIDIGNLLSKWKNSEKEIRRGLGALFYALYEELEF